MTPSPSHTSSFPSWRRSLRFFGWDPIWFGVMMTVNMAIGRSHASRGGKPVRRRQDKRPHHGADKQAVRGDADRFADSPCDHHFPGIALFLPRIMGMMWYLCVTRGACGRPFSIKGFNIWQLPVTMPKLGLTMNAGSVSRWHKRKETPWRRRNPHDRGHGQAHLRRRIPRGGAA